MLCIGHRKGEKTVYWLSLATFFIKSKEESIYGIHQLHFIYFAAIYIGLSRWLRIQRIRERGHPRQNFVRGDGMYLLDTQLQRSSQINSHGLSGGCCRRGEGTDGTILFKKWTSQWRSSKVSRWPLCPPWWGLGTVALLQLLFSRNALLSTLTISYDLLPLTYQRGCRLAGEAC